MKNDRAAAAIIMRLLLLREMSPKNQIFRDVSLIRRGINSERNRFSESCHTRLAKQTSEIVLRSPREPREKSMRTMRARDAIQQVEASRSTFRGSKSTSLKNSGAPPAAASSHTLYGPSKLPNYRPTVCYFLANTKCATDSRGAQLANSALAPHDAASQRYRQRVVVVYRKVGSAFRMHRGSIPANRLRL